MLPRFMAWKPELMVLADDEEGAEAVALLVWDDPTGVIIIDDDEDDEDDEDDAPTCIWLLVGLRRSRWIPGGERNVEGPPRPPIASMVRKDDG